MTKETVVGRASRSRLHECTLLSLVTQGIIKYGVSNLTEVWVSLIYFHNFVIISDELK